MRPFLMHRALVGLLAAATQVSGSAQAAVPTPASGATWEPNQQVGYRWKDGSEPPAWIRGAINAAAQDSNASRRARAAILSHDSDAASWVAYTPDVPSTYAIGYATRNVPTSFTVRLRPHGFVLDWGTLKWCQFYDNPPNGCYDAEMVTLHEFGHVQTLGHVDESQVEWLDSVMHAAVHSKAKVGWSMHEFGRCDVARLQIRYEPLDTATPISTCLSLPTSLTLAASTSSVAYGGYVTFTATLRIHADAQYAKLAGDALARRSVLLQRRPVGTTSWTTVDTLAPTSDGSGRYVRTVRMTASYEWRAKFVTPTDEGLDGSASAPLRVSVVEDCTSACPLSIE
jgi:hypothetical protein